MPRFLHTADWQIGRRYTRFGEEDAAALFEARFAAIGRIAALAAGQNVDAVLVAGDVFDAQTVPDRSLHRTFLAMQDFRGPWLLIAGNHDAALAESVWTRAQRIRAIPDNVHVFTEAGIYPFEAAGFAVLAAPLTQRHTHDDLTAWFEAAGTPAGLLRIGLAHGSVQGVLPEAADSANPIAASRAAAARLDYLALGDWHGLREIDARTWYSGTPEPERFKDNEPGHVLLVDIDGPGAVPRVTPHGTGVHQWRQLDRTLTVPSDVDSLLDELAALPADCVIDLTLQGHVDLTGHQRLQQAWGRIAAGQRSFTVHDGALRLQPTDEDLAALRADGYVGDVIAALRERQQNEAGETAEAAQTARDALAILAGLLAAHREPAP